MLERLRKIFIESGKSQTEIAKKTNVTSAYIWKILNKDNVKPRDLFIQKVCEEFGVSEDWLRTGIGDPTVKRTRSQEIGAFASEIMNLPDENIKNRLINALAKLDERDWETIAKIADSLKEGD